VIAVSAPAQPCAHIKQHAALVQAAVMCHAVQHALHARLRDAAIDACYALSTTKPALRRARAGGMHLRVFNALAVKPQQLSAPDISTAPEPRTCSTLSTVNAAHLTALHDIVQAVHAWVL
jgi:hypothetical protein